MKKVFAVTVSLLLTCAAVPAYSSEANDCASKANEATQQINDIKDRYAKITAERQQEYKNKAKEINDETPDTTGPDAGIKADVQLRDNWREFKFDLPNVTMKDQKMAMNLPQVTMKTQNWGWNVPELVMVTRCHAGPDETVVEEKTCHNDFPPFSYPCPEIRTRRGPDICYDEPTTRNRHEEINLDVPEVKSALTEWIIGTPEIVMQPQTWRINIPDIVVKDIEVVAEEQKKDAQQLGDQARTEGSSIASAMSRELEAANKKAIVMAFACQKNDMHNKMRESYDKITAVESTVAASYNRAKEVKATDLVVSYDSALASIKAGKKKMLEAYIKARRDLHKKQTAVLESLTLPKP